MRYFNQNNGQNERLLLNGRLFLQNQPMQIQKTFHTIWVFIELQTIFQCRKCFFFFTQFVPTFGEAVPDIAVFAKKIGIYPKNFNGFLRFAVG